MDGASHEGRTARPLEPTNLELFTPKLVTVLREGYDGTALRADAIAGLTVAIVALPLSMAIAIGSGLSPEKGLYASIIGGFIISLLGGSRFQIGGPAGAFIVLIANIVDRQGYDGLVLATLMAGLIMVVVGALRLGTFIKYIPFPVTVGFTAGIAVIIFASQVRELFGFEMAKEPAALIPKIGAIWDSKGTWNPAAIGLSCLALAIILGLRRVRPKWPGLLIAVGVCAALVGVLGLEVATIGTRFGGVPGTLPAPALPAWDFARLHALLPDAIAIALLGAIESLLSAVVADGMSGRRHRSNCELVAQGIANMATVAFGGMCVTGTIARTATNVRSGARGPVSGILHSIYLLVFMLIAAPLAYNIPLACLASVLAVVAWNMVEKDQFALLLRSSRGDALVLMATFLLTVFEDLIIAIGVGVTLGAFLFLHRMAETVEVEGGGQLIARDTSDYAAPRTAYEPNPKDSDVIVYSITGAFFFGAAAQVGAVLDRIGERPKLFVLDLTNVPLVDSTAAVALEGFVHKMRQHGAEICIAGARQSVRRVLLTAGLKRPLVRYASTAQDAVNDWPLKGRADAQS